MKRGCVCACVSAWFWSFVLCGRGGRVWTTKKKKKKQSARLPFILIPRSRRARLPPCSSPPPALATHARRCERAPVARPLSNKKQSHTCHTHTPNGGRRTRSAGRAGVGKQAAEGAGRRGEGVGRGGGGRGGDATSRSPVRWLRTRSLPPPFPGTARPPRPCARYNGPSEAVCKGPRGDGWDASKNRLDPSTPVPRPYAPLHSSPPRPPPPPPAPAPCSSTAPAPASCPPSGTRAT